MQSCQDSSVEGVSHSDEIATSAISFIETEHGRLRRKQRAISKKDLQKAKKYGIRRSSHPRPNGHPTSIYTYNEIVYVANDITGEEVTSYAIPITLDTVKITKDMRENHKKHKVIIENDLSKWKSNTVIVVDTSGSMKGSDVWETRTRLDAVWLSIALDFLALRIESGNAGPYDVVSIISMGTSSEILFYEEPTTWVLYNQIVDLYQSKSVKPSGHGNYIPSLDKAEALLKKTTNAACTLGLLFVSDGRPSDFYGAKGYDFDKGVGEISNRIGGLVKEFGRRLQFNSIGMGSFEEFDALQGMVNAAEDYGSNASLMLPSMSSSSLGDVFQSFTSSLTTTQTEMTDLETMNQMSVRPDVSRESRTRAMKKIDKISLDEFYIYPNDSVERLVPVDHFENGRRKFLLQPAPLQNKDAKFVALNKEAFGEGAERFAFRFFEVGSDARTIVGKPLVAKESRFVVEKGNCDETKRQNFVKTFCITQQFAGRIAEEFNHKLDQLYRVDDKTPRVRFLDCSVYKTDDINTGNLSMLVEERLDHMKWQKWNDNNGYVKGMDQRPVVSEEILRDVMDDMRKPTFGLGIIEEDEEDEEDEEANEDDYDTYVTNGRPSPITFTPFEVAQAFSHFSYYATGRKRLICDLQGVYDEKKNILNFTDPVIHYYNDHKLNKRCVHGRTDKGKKGIAMFHATHKDYCNKLCYLVNNGFKKALQKNKRNYDKSYRPNP